MNQEQYDGVIESYLQGRLPRGEARAVKRRIKMDPQFRRRVKLHQLLQAGVHNHLEKEFGGEDSTTADAGREARMFRLTPAWKKGLAIAASLLILAIAAREIVPTINRPQKIQVELEQSAPINLGIAGENDDALIRAQQAYNNQQWTAAITAFDDYLATTAEANYEVLLYKGIALRHAGDLSAAEESFQGLIATEQQHYAGEEARWQLALVYLEREQFAASRTLLEQLATDGRPARRERAQQLLRLLRGK